MLKMQQVRTSMPELSPAAQAVVDAYWATPNEPITTKGRLPRVAAVLQAVADQVVPEEPKECEHFTNEAIRLNRMGVRAELLAIAAELEAQ